MKLLIAICFILLVACNTNETVDESEDKNVIVKDDVEKLEKNRTFLERDIQEMEQLIKTGEYDLAIEKVNVKELKKLEGFSEFASSYLTLKDYAQTLKDKEKMGVTSEYLDFLIHLPEGYNGALKEKLLDEKANLPQLTMDLIDKGEYDVPATLNEDIFQYFYKTVMNDSSLSDLEKYDIISSRTLNSIDEIYNYITALQFENEGNQDMMVHMLANISNDYRGFLSDDIKKKKMTIMSLEEWDVIQNGQLALEKKIIGKQVENNKNEAEYAKKSNLQIGMTAEEVRGSKWGLPNKINKTTTEYGISEQWVYSDYKYLYFENGVLTTIQD